MTTRRTAAAHVDSQVDDYLAGKRYPIEMIHTHPSCIYTYV